MCESTVYSTKGKMIMEDVISIKIQDQKIEIKDILNQQLTLEGMIVEINLEKHQIYVEIF
jgi:predicted RNA-binding protein